MAEYVDGKKYAYLQWLDPGDNKYRFYEMKELGNGNLLTKWGRIEGGAGQQKEIPMSEWDRKYREKTRKGYEDVTDTKVIRKTTAPAKAAMPKAKESGIDPQVQEFVDQLQAYAKNTIAKHYNVSTATVTPRMVEKAQDLLNEIIPLIKIDTDLSTLNERYTKLLGVITRKIPPRHGGMGGMADLLFTPIRNEPELAEANRKIMAEQDMLDAMRGQVQTIQIDEPTTTEIDKTASTLTKLGLKMIPCSSADITEIKAHMGSDAHRFQRAFRVEQAKTQSRFMTWLHKMLDKKKELFWHGSRNENWWNILQTGLFLRPSNVITTGKMFGYGLYFADKFVKSFGYTSAQGSYWARGTSASGILALFEVHVGKQFHIRKHEPWCYELTEDKLKQKGDYDSLFAEGGADLRNNEYIVYNEQQVTIKYIVEVR